MVKVTRESVLKRQFIDRKHYPYGFSRSGDFSIAESKALTHYGCLIAALVDGQLAPSSEEDKHFIAVAAGVQQPSSAAERAWLKYQTLINRPKMASIYGSKRVIDDSDGDEVDSDDSVDLDLDEA